MVAAVGRSYAHLVVEEDSRIQVATATISELDKSVDAHENAKQPEQCGDQLCSTREWLYFFLFGMGPGYAMLDAIFVELPWFQAVQPEGLKLASHMTLAAATALAVGVPIYIILSRFMQYRYIIPTLTSSSFVLALISASTWSVVIGGVSIAILLVAFLTSTVGNMQTIVVIPWLSFMVKPRLLSAVMSGSNFGSLLSAGLSLLQGPGKHQLFSPTLFFFILSLFLLLPLFAYYRISTTRLGMLDTPEKESDAPQGVSVPELAEEPIQCAHYQLRACSTFLVPPFWRQAFMLCAINAFLQIFCWGVLRAILPFAAASTVNDSERESCDEASGDACTSSHVVGGEVLQYCIELSYLGVTAGSFSSSLCKFGNARDLYPHVGAFALLTCFVFSAAIGSPVWKNVGADMFLVIVVVSIRFIDGFLSPLLFRIVAVEFSSESASVSQWIAVIEKICTFITTAIVYIVVEIAA